MEENKKLYSQRAIGIATFFGGPLAAGILIRKNFINLGKEAQGLYAVIIGMVATFLLFAGLFSIPESVIDNVPHVLIPTIYTGVIYLIVEAIQGKELKAFKEGQGVFYSVWNAAGIGLLSAVLLVGSFLGYFLLEEASWDTRTYDAKMVLYAANEEEAMQVYELLEAAPKVKIIRFINDTGLPKWRENQEILLSMAAIADMPEEVRAQVELLKKYTDLRIKVYQLMVRDIRSGALGFSAEVLDLHQQIDELIAQM